MEKLSALLLSLALSGCAGKATPTVNLEPAPLPESIALMGKFGAAHACPVDGYIVTSAHVAFPFSQGREMQISYAYEFRGARGVALPYVPNLVVDLALMQTDPAIAEFYSRGVPVEGAEVQWTEYDFRTVGNAFRPRLRRAKVVNIVAGHVMLNQEPTAGASGACVFNEANEVVAIISFGHGTEGTELFGGAVDLSTLPPAGAM